VELPLQILTRKQSAKRLSLQKKSGNEKRKKKKGDKICRTILKKIKICGAII
jgi:hypothetical protein